MEKKLIEAQGIHYDGISTGKFRRYLSAKNISDPFRVIKGFRQAKELIREYKPDVVFSKGALSPFLSYWQPDIITFLLSFMSLI